MKLPVSSKYISLLATALVLIALYTVGCVSFPNFGSLRVAVNLVGDNAFLGVAAIGATFVILSGGIDLSVGAAVAFTSILIASLVGSGLNPFLVIVIALLIGAIFGTAMGCLIQWFELPPFLVTLAGMFLARGLCYTIGTESIPITDPFCTKMGDSIHIGVYRISPSDIITLKAVMVKIENTNSLRAQTVSSTAL